MQGDGHIDRILNNPSDSVSVGKQGHHNVLEVGFGPGLGLKEACKKIDVGCVYGIEVSDRMIEDASKLLRDEIQAGKMKISKQRYNKNV
jgi:cyclopropane fatty-acyl-phospholipid synthase-like methyltransferase